MTRHGSRRPPEQPAGVGWHTRDQKTRPSGRVWQCSEGEPAPTMYWADPRRGVLQTYENRARFPAEPACIGRIRAGALVRPSPIRVRGRPGSGPPRSGGRQAPGRLCRCALPTLDRRMIGAVDSLRRPLPVELSGTGKTTGGACGRRGMLFQHPLYRWSNLIGVLGLDEHARIAEQLWKCAAVGGYDWNAERHGFEHREPEPLFKRRLDEEARSFVERAALSGVDVADITNGVLKRWLRDSLQPGPGFIRRSAGDDQFGLAPGSRAVCSADNPFVRV